MIPIPDDGLAEWARALSDKCLESAPARKARYTGLRALFDDGAYEPSRGVQNVVKPAIERLAGMLFSPQKLAFLMQYSRSVDPKTAASAAMASRILTASFMSARAHLSFGAAVRDALVCGTSVLKIRPTGDTGAFEVDIVMPENFGVLRESDPDISRQQAVCEVSYPTVYQVRDMLGGRPDAAKLMERIEEAAGRDDGGADGPRRPRIAIGTPDPIGSGGSGNLTVASRTGASIVSEPASVPTVEMRELWVSDADRDGKMTTIQLVLPDIVLLGEITRGNALLPRQLPNAPSTLAETLPYRVVCPYPARADFWGWSLVSALAAHQDAVNEQRVLIDRARRRKRRPVVGLSGFAGITEEQYDAMLTRGRLLIADNPAAKASELPSPDLGPLYEALNAEMALVDQTVGFPAVLRGEGEGSVRSQGHAETLVRTASPRLISPATEVEAALTEVASLAFRIMQDYDGQSYSGHETGQFLLRQVEGGWYMTADSHSATPVFSEDDRILTLDLAKIGVLDPEDTIRMLRLPDADLLVAHVRERAAAMRQEMQARAAAGEAQKAEKSRKK